MRGPTAVGNVKEREAQREMRGRGHFWFENNLRRYTSPTLNGPQQEQDTFSERK
jgi:hypothetical protein